jgi:general L-amino acid transport system permease protein
MAAALVHRRPDVGRWLRKNLFRNRLDGVVTVTSAVAIAYLLYRVVRFVLVTGRWDIVRVNLKLLMVGRYPDVHLPRVAVSLVVAGLVAGLIAGVVHRRQVEAGTSAVAGMGLGERVVDLVERFWPLILGVVLVLGLSSTPGPWLAAAGAAAACLLGRLVGGRVPRATHGALVVAAIATPFALVAYLADGAGWDGWGGLMVNVFMAVAAIILCYPLGCCSRSGDVRRCR